MILRVFPNNYRHAQNRAHQRLQLLYALHTPMSITLNFTFTLGSLKKITCQMSKLKASAIGLHTYCWGGGDQKSIRVHV